MMIDFRKLNIYLIVSFLSVSVFAQDSKLMKADQIYDDLGYSAAINLYLSSVQGESTTKMDRKSMIRLANSYRLTGDYQNAEKWYGQIVETSEKPLYRLYYAQALQANGKCEQARKYFLEYHNMIVGNPGTDDGGKGIDMRGRTLAEGCNMEFTDQKGVTLKNLSGINSTKFDFSPAFYRDGVVFVSNQESFSTTKSNDLWINDEFFDLFVASTDDNGNLTNAEPFSSKINSKFHEGQVTFDQAGETMYFTRSNFNGKLGKDAEGVTQLKIYSAQKLGGSWDNIQELPFNNDNRSVCHPTLSADGSKLFFAAGSGKRGFGGLDLYVSHFRNGVWSKPHNLGAELNTKGNESFPFIHEDGSLYFASNGHAGRGGLDIFVSKMVEMGDTVIWTPPVNLGEPFNSKKDDFGFIIDTRKKMGFLSSNRPGGRGEDDIYRFKMPIGENLEPEKPPIVFNAKLSVIDEASGNPVESAVVSISNCGEGGEGFTAKLIPIEGKPNEFMLRILSGKADGVVTKMFTDENGQVIYGLNPDSDYCFTVEKDGYETAEQELSTRNYMSNRDMTLSVPMVKAAPCMQVEGVVNNKRYKNAVPNATVKIVNKYTGETINLASDNNGKFSKCVPCGFEYEIIATQEVIGEDRLNLPALDNNCDKGKAITLDLDKMPVASVPPPVRNPVPNPSLPSNDPGGISGFPDVSPDAPPFGNPGLDPESIFNSGNSSSPDFDPASLNINESIVLTNIFYDYNKDYFRPESVNELERLVRLLLSNARLSLEIGSHTDSRGSKEYNKNLSQRRADNAVSYMVKRGVSKSQLLARGYGEIDPLIPCAPDDCTEEEHALNRRTEFRVIGLD